MRTRLLRGIIAVVAAIAVLYAGGEKTHPTNVVVLQRARDAATRVSNRIGPNTTFHAVGLERTAHPVAGDTCDRPADLKSESWAVFDADGTLSSWNVATTDAAGKVYSILRFTPPSTLVSTDVVSGKIGTLPLHYTPNATTFAAALNEGFDAAYPGGAKQPDAGAVMERDAAGAMTYVITTANSRAYIDESSYQVVQSDELAPDGSVTKSGQVSVWEVLPGEVAPIVTPIAGAPSMPCVPATAAAGQSAVAVVTGDAAVDRLIADVRASDDIELAGLVGFQKIACRQGSPGGNGDQPPCRPAEPDGALVEVLPASGCATSWVRPEQVTDLFRITLPAGTSQLLAVFIPAATTTLFGSGFGAREVAVFHTGTHSSGDGAGAALHIRDGRVVWVEADCRNLLELLAPDRVASFIVAANAARASTPVP